MNIEINDVITLTTEHPQSSYGLGVVVDIHGKTWMPSDLFPVPEGLQLILANSKPAGYFESRTMAVALVELANTGRFNEAELEQLKKYLSQHPNPSENETLVD